MNCATAISFYCSGLQIAVKRDSPLCLLVKVLTFDDAQARVLDFPRPEHGTLFPFCFAVLKESYGLGAEVNPLGSDEAFLEVVGWHGGLLAVGTARRDTELLEFVVDEIGGLEVVRLRR